jgi:zinc/manganese transport system permease protein
MFRPLLLTSVVPQVAEARGIRGQQMEMGFLVVVAVATTMSVPVVGALLMFSLMIGAPGAARVVTKKPIAALGLSVAISLLIVWAAIAASYETDWPVGFFVGVLGAVFFMAARLWTSWRRSRARRPERALSQPAAAPNLVPQVGAATGPGASPA